MATAVIMPKAGISVESCIITGWRKRPGDAVAEGDILFSYETDKASFECESTAAGTLIARFFEDGDEVPVLVNVCAVGEPGEDIAALRPGDEGAAPTAPMPGTDQDELLRISPRARNLAGAQHIDTRLASPSGPYGRIVERDIRTLMHGGAGATSAAFAAVEVAQAGAYQGTGIGARVRVEDLAKAEFIPAADAPPSPAIDASAYEDIAFSGIRRVISASMTQSLSTIPQLTHHFSFNAADIMAYRKALKANGEALGLSGITLGDMVMYAAARLLPKYPQLNAHMLDAATIRQFRDVHLGFACDTERGLVVPVVKHANRMGLAELSQEVKALARQAQAGNLPPDAMTGATFTVSNLGAFAVESFTPVINPPQTGILGVDTIVNRACEADGQIRLYPAMGLSLTYDHRAIDGAPASRFVKELCGLLEHFTLLLAK